MTKLRMKMRRMWRRTLHWLNDPPLDVIGAGVISTLVGRTWLFGAFALGFASVGLYLQALAFFLVLSVDVITHIEVLGALRRLMGYDVLAELARPQLEM